MKGQLDGAAQQTVELGPGRRATYEVAGSGPPMFWFEGGPGLSARLSRPEARLLSESFAVYLIDPHGSGGSTPPLDAAQYDHIGHARFYDTVRRALGLDRVTIAGISFGGTVALTYASMFPEATVRCIAVSAFALGTEVDEGDAAAEMELMLSRHTGAPWYPEARKTWDGWTDQVLAAEDPAEVNEMLGEVLPLYLAHPDRPDVRALVESARREVRMNLVAVKAWESGLYQGIDLRPLLAKIIRPTLVVAGELDLIGGPSQARQIARGVARADLAIIPDCGHIPAWEAPEQFKAILLDWCSTH
jgi:pimeloyl-ACP methyl ester carboxylesterase